MSGSSPPALSAEIANTPASDIAVFDLAGRQVDPFATADSKAFVFVFVSTECPISNRYAPEIRRVAEEFARAGVRFWLVYPDLDATGEVIQKHVKEYQLPLGVLRDPRHNLVRTQQDLRNVLEAVVRGKPVPYATARAVGCYISDEK